MREMPTIAAYRRRGLIAGNAFKFSTPEGIDHALKVNPAMHAFEVQEVSGRTVYWLVESADYAAVLSHGHKPLRRRT